MGLLGKFKNSLKSQETLDLELLSLCGVKGSYSEMAEKLAAGANPNSTKWASTALVDTLHLAVAIENRNEVISKLKLLLANGADANLADRCGITALMHACRIGDADIVEFMLNNGAKSRINQADKMGYTPLLWALGAANREDWGFGYFFANASGRKRTVELLLQFGANANVQDADGKKATDWALKISTEIASLLATKGAKSSHR